MKILIQTMNKQTMNIWLIIALLVQPALGKGSSQSKYATLSTVLLTVFGVFFGLVILCLVHDKLCRRTETQDVQEEKQEKKEKKEKKQVDPDVQEEKQKKKEKKVDMKQEEEKQKKETRCSF